MAYRIEFSLPARDHLRARSAHLRRTALDEIEARLCHQPTVRTRNRKPMHSNLIAVWELRAGRLRVYYDVEESPRQVVLIQAIGEKIRDKVFINGRAIDL